MVGSEAPQSAASEFATLGIERHPVLLLLLLTAIQVPQQGQVLWICLYPDQTSRLIAPAHLERQRWLLQATINYLQKTRKIEAFEAVKFSALVIVPVGTTAATDNAYLPANMTIEVAPNGRYCRVWNDTNDEEIIRSKN